MELINIVNQIDKFSNRNHVEKIKFFAWFLQTQKGKLEFSPKDVLNCYEILNLEKPSSIHPFFKSLSEKKPKMLLKSRNGYQLEMNVLNSFTSIYAKNPDTIRIRNLLEKLPEVIPNIAERTFLEETLKCIKTEAFRASIVMSWNLAFHHLCDYVLLDAKRTLDFNSSWAIVYPGHHKSKTKMIAVINDFSEMIKESEVIEICKNAGIITKDISKILKQKLEKRNSAAHPSSIKFSQLQAEECVDDLINNVVLKLQK